MSHPVVIMVIVNVYRSTSSPLALATLDVRNLREARESNHLYDAVVTAGPDASEVRWDHWNHIVEEFEDVTDPAWGPQVAQIEALVDFGARQPGSILVHCHAGISRSTATAWGIAVARGATPLAALDDLMARHPVERGLGESRPFSPNLRIVEHLVTIFDDPTFLEIHDIRIGDDLDRWW